MCGCSLFFHSEKTHLIAWKMMPKPSGPFIRQKSINKLHLYKVHHAYILCGTHSKWGKLWNRARFGCESRGESSTLGRVQRRYPFHTYEGVFLSSMKVQQVKLHTMPQKKKRSPMVILASMPRFHDLIDNRRFDENRTASARCFSSTRLHRKPNRTARCSSLSAVEE
jgi:hypothetical protein